MYFFQIETVCAKSLPVHLSHLTNMLIEAAFLRYEYRFARKLSVILAEYKQVIIQIEQMGFFFNKK